MTYKKFAEMMIEQEACEWIKEMVGKEYSIWNAETKLEKAKDGDIEYEVSVYVYQPGTPTSFIHKQLIVGGVVGEYVGICNSVIWKPGKYGNEVIWLKQESTRKELGITEFVF